MSPSTLQTQTHWMNTSERTPRAHCWRSRRLWQNEQTCGKVFPNYRWELRQKSHKWSGFLLLIKDPGGTSQGYSISTLRYFDFYMPHSHIQVILDLWWRSLTVFFKKEKRKIGRIVQIRWEDRHNCHSFKLTTSLVLAYLAYFILHSHVCFV